MDDLKTILEKERVNLSYFERLSHSHDLAPVPDRIAANYNNIPSAVVKPTTVKEVEELVKFAERKKTCLVPKGRGTSYLWGSVPVVGGIVVDMVEMNDIYDFNEEDEWIEAGAGATWEKLEDHLETHGHTLRVYPTSMPAATLGGWISSAGSGLGEGGYGVGSLMYGAVGENIMGLEAVTGTGEIHELLTPNDISEFVGTDGITAIITKVRLRTRKRTEFSQKVFVSVPDENSLSNLVVLLQNLKTSYYAQFEDEGIVRCKLSIGLHSVPCNEGFLFFIVFEGNKSDVVTESSEFLEAVKKEKGSVLPEPEAEKEWENRCYPMRLKRGGPTVIAGEFTVNAEQLHLAIKDAHSESLGIEKSGIHGVVAKKPHVVLMPQVLSDERRGFGFLASLSYSKRFNDIGPRYGGKPYGVGHLNAFNSRLVHGNDGFDRLRKLKKKYNPQNVINPGKGIEHMTKFGVPVPSFMFNLSMSALGLFRKMGV